MTHSRPVAPSERVVIKCPECGERRTLTARQARRAGFCPYCRYKVKIEVTDRHRRYWTDRYSMNEIMLLATNMFEDLADSRPALVASSKPDQKETFRS